MDWKKEYYPVRPMPDWVAATLGTLCALSAWHIAALFEILSPQEGRIVVWVFTVFAVIMTLYGLISRHRLALGQIDALTVNQRLNAVSGVAMLVGIVAIALAAYLFPTSVHQAMVWSLADGPHLTGY
jgi:uncharacterized membrane protein